MQQLHSNLFSSGILKNDQGAGKLRFSRGGACKRGSTGMRMPFAPGVPLPSLSKGTPASTGVSMTNAQRVTDRNEPGTAATGHRQERVTVTVGDRQE